MIEKVNGRPKFWYCLPYCLMCGLADSCGLDYDSYESSHQAALHSILCNPDITSQNGEMIQGKYESISNRGLFDMVANTIQGKKSELDRLIGFRNELVLEDRNIS